MFFLAVLIIIILLGGGWIVIGGLAAVGIGLFVFLKDWYWWIVAAAVIAAIFGRPDSAPPIEKKKPEAGPIRLSDPRLRDDERFIIDKPCSSCGKKMMRAAKKCSECGAKA